MDTFNYGSLKFSQLHLGKSLLDVTRMAKGAAAYTPSSGLLFRHTEFKPFNRLFNHWSAIGIPQHLGNNTKPDCSCAMNSCACFCIDPCKPHGQAVKHIAWCVKATTEEGLIFKPNSLNPVLDCHVDTDFAGNWNPKDAKDPSGVKSQISYLLTFGGVPLFWCSVTQKCIALSTEESRCIALSAAMHGLVHVRTLLSKISAKFNLAYWD